ncbi:MAG: hypothetical protein ACYDC3_05010 [Candidatus Binataceae bacterium]
MEAQVKQFFGRITCSVCLQERTPARARVFIVVGEEEGDPAVMGFCYAHAAQRTGAFKSMVRHVAAEKFAPHPETPLRPRV